MTQARYDTSNPLVRKREHAFFVARRMPVAFQILGAESGDAGDYVVNFAFPDWGPTTPAYRVAPDDEAIATWQIPRSQESVASYLAQPGRHTIRTQIDIRIMRHPADAPEQRLEDACMDNWLDENLEQAAEPVVYPGEFVIDIAVGIPGASRQYISTADRVEQHLAWVLRQFNINFDPTIRHVPIAELGEAGLIGARIEPVVAQPTVVPEASIAQESSVAHTL